MFSLARGLARVVADLLAGVLGAYVDNVSPEQVAASLVGGAIALRGLRLRRGALDALELPVALARGEVALLSIRVDWLRLLSRPLLVEVRGVSLQLAPRPPEEWGEEASERRHEQWRRQALAASEARAVAAHVHAARGGGGGGGGGGGLLGSPAAQRVMAALASKLRACVKVEGVRVAYADAQASPERPFELALSLDTLSASTLSAADAARALDGKQGAAVALETELKALRVTWRPLTEPGEAEGERLLECSARATVAWFPAEEGPAGGSSATTASASAPLVLLSAHVERVRCAASAGALSDAVVLADALATAKTRARTWRYRPHCRLSASRGAAAGWAREWWRYAGRAALAARRKRGVAHMVRWYAQEGIALRARYTEQYARKFERLLRGADRSAFLEEQCASLEDEMPTVDLLACREEAVRKAVRRFAQAADGVHGGGTMTPIPVVSPPYASSGSTPALKAAARSAAPSPGATASGNSSMLGRLYSASATAVYNVLGFSRAGEQAPPAGSALPGAGATDDSEEMRKLVDSLERLEHVPSSSLAAAMRFQFKVSLEGANIDLRARGGAAMTALWIEVDECGANGMGTVGGKLSAALRCAGAGVCTAFGQPWLELGATRCLPHAPATGEEADADAFVMRAVPGPDAVGERLECRIACIRYRHDARAAACLARLATEMPQPHATRVASSVDFLSSDERAAVAREHFGREACDDADGNIRRAFKLTLRASDIRASIGGVTLCFDSVAAVLDKPSARLVDLAGDLPGPESSSTVDVIDNMHAIGNDAPALQTLRVCVDAHLVAGDLEGNSPTTVCGLGGVRFDVRQAALQVVGRPFVTIDLRLPPVVAELDAMALRAISAAAGALGEPASTDGSFATSSGRGVEDVRKSGADALPSFVARVAVPLFAVSVNSDDAPGSCIAAVACNVSASVHSGIRERLAVNINASRLGLYLGSKNALHNVDVRALLVELNTVNQKGALEVELLQDSGGVEVRLKAGGIKGKVDHAARVAIEGAAKLLLEGAAGGDGATVDASRDGERNGGSVFGAAGGASSAVVSLELGESEVCIADAAGEFAWIGMCRCSAEAFVGVAEVPQVVANLEGFFIRSTIKPHEYILGYTSLPGTGAANIEIKYGHGEAPLSIALRNQSVAVAWPFNDRLAALLEPVLRDGDIDGSFEVAEVIPAGASTFTLRIDVELVDCEVRYPHRPGSGSKVAMKIVIPRLALSLPKAPRRTPDMLPDWVARAGCAINNIRFNFYGLDVFMEMPSGSALCPVQDVPIVFGLRGVLEYGMHLAQPSGETIYECYSWDLEPLRVQVSELCPLAGAIWKNREGTPDKPGVPTAQLLRLAQVDATVGFSCERARLDAESDTGGVCRLLLQGAEIETFGDDRDAANPLTRMAVSLESLSVAHVGTHEDAPRARPFASLSMVPGRDYVRVTSSAEGTIAEVTLAQVSLTALPVDMLACQVAPATISTGERIALELYDKRQPQAPTAHEAEGTGTASPVSPAPVAFNGRVGVVSLALPMLCASGDLCDMIDISELAADVKQRGSALALRLGIDFVDARVSHDILCAARELGNTLVALSAGNGDGLQGPSTPDWAAIVPATQASVSIGGLKLTVEEAKSALARLVVCEHTCSLSAGRGLSDVDLQLNALVGVEARHLDLAAWEPAVETFDVRLHAHRQRMAAHHVVDEVHVGIADAHPVDINITGAIAESLSLACSTLGGGDHAHVAATSRSIANDTGMALDFWQAELDEVIGDRQPDGTLRAGDVSTKGQIGMRCSHVVVGFHGGDTRSPALPWQRSAGALFHVGFAHLGLRKAAIRCTVEGAAHGRRLRVSSSLTVLNSMGLPVHVRFVHPFALCEPDACALQIAPGERAPVPVDLGEEARLCVRPLVADGDAGTGECFYDWCDALPLRTLLAAAPAAQGAPTTRRCGSLCSSRPPMFCSVTAAADEGIPGTNGATVALLSPLHVVNDLPCAISVDLCTPGVDCGCTVHLLPGASSAVHSCDPRCPVTVAVLIACSGDGGDFVAPSLSPAPAACVVPPHVPLPARRGRGAVGSAYFRAKLSLSSDTPGMPPATVDVIAEGVAGGSRRVIVSCALVVFNLSTLDLRLRLDAGVGEPRDVAMFPPMAARSRGQYRRAPRRSTLLAMEASPGENSPGLGGIPAIANAPAVVFGGDGADTRARSLSACSPALRASAAALGTPSPARSIGDTESPSPWTPAVACDSGGASSERAAGRRRGVMYSVPTGARVPVRRLRCELAARASAGAEWATGSCDLDLLSAGVTQAARALGADGQGYDLALEHVVSPMHAHKTLLIRARYELSNETERIVTFTQDGFGTHVLQPGEVRAVRAMQTGADAALFRVRFNEAGWDFSGGFPLSLGGGSGSGTAAAVLKVCHCDDTVVLLSAEATPRPAMQWHTPQHEGSAESSLGSDSDDEAALGYGLAGEPRSETWCAGAATRISLRERGALWPFRVDNITSSALVVEQEGLGERGRRLVLRPYECRQYAWDEPFAARRRLRVSELNGKVVAVFALDGDHPRALTPLASRAAALFDRAHRSRPLAHSGRAPDLRLRCRVRSERHQRVVEIVVGRQPTSPSPRRSLTFGPAREQLATAAGGSAVQPHLRLSVRLGCVGVSLVDRAAGAEVAYACLRAAEFHAAIPPAGDARYELRVGEVRVDNQARGADFQAVLWSAAGVGVGVGVVPRGGQRDALRATVRCARAHSSSRRAAAEDVLTLRDVDVAVAPLHVQLEDHLIRVLMELAERLADATHGDAGGALGTTSGAGSSQSMPGTPTRPLTTASLHGAAALDATGAAGNGERIRVHLERVHVSPLQVWLSYNSSALPLPPALLPAALRHGDVAALAVRAAYRMLACDNLPLALSALTLQHRTLSASSAGGVLAEAARAAVPHYRWQALAVGLRVLMSADVLGNPAGMLTAIGEGVTSFVRRPMRGLRRLDAREALEGVLEGTASLAQGAAVALLTGVSHISAFGRKLSLAALSLSSASLALVEVTASARRGHRARNARLRALGPGGGSDESVVAGALKGLTGVLSALEEGLESGDPMVLLASTALGALAAVARPAAALFQSVFKAAQAARGRLRGLPPRRVRAPRYLPAGAPLPRYDADVAQAHSLLRALADAPGAGVVHEAPVAGTPAAIEGVFGSAPSLAASVVLRRAGDPLRGDAPIPCLFVASQRALLMAARDEVAGEGDGARATAAEDAALVWRARRDDVLSHAVEGNEVALLALSPPPSTADPADALWWEQGSLGARAAASGPARGPLTACVVRFADEGAAQTFAAMMAADRTDAVGRRAGGARVITRAALLARARVAMRRA